MRAAMESGFYVIYLVFILWVGVHTIRNKKVHGSFLFFGLACFILGFGDAFHLVPRAIGLFTNTLDAPNETLAMWLGIGKLVTSITMTAFYVLFYFFIYERLGLKRNKALDYVVYGLALARVVLCAFPQNGWLTNASDLLWGTLRNIPFVALGIIVIVLSFLKLRKTYPYGWLYIAFILSFAFYLPVVFLAGTYSWVGMMMLPKTLCYMWIGVLALLDAKNLKKKENAQ